MSSDEEAGACDAAMPKPEQAGLKRIIGSSLSSLHAAAHIK
jgi:hypothetical protein